jgi:hypothetical protein
VIAPPPLFPRPRPRRRAENLPSAGLTPSVALRRARTNASSGARAPGRHCSPPGGAGGGGHCVCIQNCGICVSLCLPPSLPLSLRLWRRGGQMHARTQAQAHTWAHELGNNLTNASARIRANRDVSTHSARSACTGRGGLSACTSAWRRT